MKKLSTLCCLALLCATSLFAADGDKEKKEMDASLEFGMSAQASGTIDSVFSTEMDGVGEPHILVRLKGEDGEFDVVDLGSGAALKKNSMEPREGQRLSVAGRVGNLNNKQVLVAETISEGKIVSIDRRMPRKAKLDKDKKDHTAADHKNMANDDDACFHLVEGRVIGTRSVKLESDAEEHLFVKINTDDGMVVVDLGGKTGMPKVDTSEGQSIAVAGFASSINGKPFIRAHAAGNMSRVVRPKESAAAEQK